MLKVCTECITMELGLTDCERMPFCFSAKMAEEIIFNIDAMCDTEAMWVAAWKGMFRCADAAFEECQIIEQPELSLIHI